MLHVRAVAFLVFLALPSVLSGQGRDLVLRLDSQGMARGSITVDSPSQAARILRSLGSRAATLVVDEDDPSGKIQALVRALAFPRVEVVTRPPHLDEDLLVVRSTGERYEVLASGLGKTEVRELVRASGSRTVSLEVAGDAPSAAVFRIQEALVEAGVRTVTIR